MKKVVMADLLKDIIGAQLSSVTTHSFTVRTPAGKILEFQFEEDEGECCGYNNLSTTLYFDSDDITNNPVITNFSYETSQSASQPGQSATITLFGLNRTIAKFESFSCSGSGYWYGATVTLKCHYTNKYIEYSIVSER